MILESLRCGKIPQNICVLDEYLVPVLPQRSTLSSTEHLKKCVSVPETQNNGSDDDKCCERVTRSVTLDNHQPPLHLGSAVKESKPKIKHRIFFKEMTKKWLYIALTFSIKSINGNGLHLYSTFLHLH